MDLGANVLFEWVGNLCPLHKWTSCVGVLIEIPCDSRVEMTICMFETFPHECQSLCFLSFSFFFNILGACDKSGTSTSL
jgi:hypothetical protein